ncbi:MAG: hypothetical protein OET90_10340 [Desulfuromonadales bacterium]|nr:hypothetical protein [Desulfuromonadales bacterium]
MVLKFYRIAADVNVDKWKRYLGGEEGLCCLLAVWMVVSSALAGLGSHEMMGLGIL